VSSNSKGLIADGEELCFGCHKSLEKLKSAASVHVPFQTGGCDTCHSAHASDRADLLTGEPTALCRTCHDTADPALTRAHKNFPAGSLKCLSCHNPHGSERPKLIRSKTHEVFTGCARCHDTTGSKPQALQTKTTTELCYRCHSPVKRAAEKPGAHKALEKGCTTCHDPHTADSKGLIRGDERRACLSCHPVIAEQLAKSVSIHPLKAGGGRCSICHEPHQSGQKALLKGDLNVLCSGCHKGHEQFGHPVGSNVLDPRTQQPLTCLSCHAAHGSQQRAILRQDPQRTLCLQCHDSNETMGARSSVTGGGR
jgi:predicted CXXCH cytochrome family protein